MKPTLQLILDQGFATGNDKREDWIPMMLLQNVSGMTADAEGLRVSFVTVEAANQAHERTGWPFAAERTLVIQTAGDHFTAKPPPFSKCATAFYARWFIQPCSSRPPLN